MADRLAQISGHITNTYGRGLLAGEVAIITGSGQGIGRSAALLFAKEGAKVVVTDIDASKVDIVVNEIQKLGGDAIGVAGDVAGDDFPERIVEATIQKYGKINHIVNNAGFTFDKMLHSMSDETYDIIMKVHVRAPFRLVRTAAPYFRIKNGARENRTVTMISSTVGLHGNIGQANYAAAKAAVLGLTKTIAKEWGSFGVRANAIAYGPIQTRLTGARAAGAFLEIDGKKVPLGIPQPSSGSDSGLNRATVPLGRSGTPDEAAAAMLFLSSPLSSYITGHTLEVTGGLGI